MRRFRPYLKYLRAVRVPLAWALVFSLIYAVANGAGLPLMMKKVLPEIFREGAAPLTTLEIVVLALWLPAIFSVRGVAGFVNRYLIQLCGVRVLEALRRDYFEKLQRVPLSFLQRQSTGDLISRGLADANQLQSTLTNVANDLLLQPATLIASTATIAILAYRERGVVLVLACLAIVPLCVLPIRYVGKMILHRAEQLQRQLGSVTGGFSESLGAAREVRAFGLEDQEIGRFAALCRALVTSQMKVAKYNLGLTPAIEIISAVGLSVTLVYGYHIHIQWGSFLAILTALYLSYDPIKKLGGVNNELKRGRVALDRLEVVLNEPITIADPPAPAPVGRLRGDLAFTDVTFAYNGDTPALRNVTVSLPVGTVCALVGPSGAGKSTFANLVPRFYDVNQGAVTIDGIDVRAMRLSDLRRNIALVSQEPVLFNDTIYNNLLFGRPNATRDAVMAAAIDAHADEFIRGLPQGYATVVGERGSTLSGGQKQRIAIARAFLRNAPILILDEATSALDSQSEQMVQEALHQLVAGKTVIIIAHRFSTIRDASLILVFDHGAIVAQGTHAALYADNPLYKSLYDRQHAGAA